jgi:hypothetical protein
MENPKGKVGSFADAAKFGELMVLALKGAVAAEALRAAGTGNLAAKTVINATNGAPVGMLFVVPEVTATAILKPGRVLMDFEKLKRSCRRSSRIGSRTRRESRDGRVCILGAGAAGERST